MKDILGPNSMLNPEKLKKNKLRELKFPPKSISELMLLKEILTLTDGDSPVPLPQIRTKIDEIISLLDKDAETIRIETDLAKTNNNYSQMMHDAEKLKQLEFDLPKAGLTTEDQDYEIQRSVRHIMGDLAGDSTIDPKNITKQNLQAKGLDPERIAEIMKLKNIWSEVEGGGPVDVAHLREELDEVIGEIEKDAEVARIDEDVRGNGDEYTKMMHDAGKLKGLELVLPSGGVTNADQDYEIQKSVRDIMKDLAGDQELDPENMTKKGLRQKGLDPTTIDELMKLKVIWNEVKDGKPVDASHLKDELDEVIAEIEKDAEHKRAEDDILKNAD
jgi:hypothetical protein